MSMLGHNRGPTMARGQRYRTYLWSRARRNLMGNTLPIKTLQMRLKRAAELGLDYRTYASVRSASGRDIVAILFSSNALNAVGASPVIPQAETARLEALKNCGRLAMVHLPHRPADFQAANPVLDVVHAAPRFDLGWPDMRDRVRAAIRSARAPADGVLIVGDTALEREWLVAGRAAGYVAAGDYFGT